MMRIGCLMFVLALTATGPVAWGGDCGCGAPRECEKWQCPKHRHHCGCRHPWCEPAPQGMVVASYPAFPVAAYPVYSAPASYTLNFPAAPQAPLDDAAIKALQRYLDDARARAPSQCNGAKSLAPLQAPTPPADNTETRLSQLEANMDSLKASVNQILELVKKDGK